MIGRRIAHLFLEEAAVLFEARATMNWSRFWVRAARAGGRDDLAARLATSRDS